ncbi:MAG: LysM peptidoglycan-binding domain-containing protein, partial [Bacteroidetes bacterium]|nr:LysM peptidoglycan-binding domain-containing protein [Bacteroidota bacterium]
LHAATPPYFPGKGYPLLVPDGMGPVFASDYQKLPKSAKLSLAFHRVRWGESLYSIAMMYHVSLASLRRANHIPQYDRLIRPGMVLIIPVSSSYYAGRRGYGLDEVASGNGTHRHSSGSIHIVRRGENLGLIAEEYGTTVRNLERLNNLRGSWIRAGMRLIVSGRASIAAKKLSANLQSPTSSNSAFHRVRWGETLIGIAGRYNVTVSDLRNWNNLPSSRINVGERLRVAPDVAAVNVSQKDIDPPDQTPDADSRMIYRVRQGDSLWSIAQKFGVSLDQLREWNNTARRDIHPGQRIVIYN